MEKYIGTKEINAKPMTRKEYNDFRGWELPLNENGADEGFLVEYCDKVNIPNTDTFAGYVSWSPKEVFELACKSNGNFSFGDAVLLLKQGKKVARKGWNGKGMYIRFVDTTQELNRHFEIYNSSQTFDTWVPSVSDCLAEDWQEA